MCVPMECTIYGYTIGTIFRNTGRRSPRSVRFYRPDVVFTHQFHLFAQGIREALVHMDHDSLAPRKNHEFSTVTI